MIPRCSFRIGAHIALECFLTDAAVSENIALGMLPEGIDHDRIHNASRIAKIDQFILEGMPQAYQTQVVQRDVRLSGGQRQRIGITSAMYHDADLIGFDEITGTLDTPSERKLMSAIDAIFQSPAMQADGASASSKGADD